MGDDVIESGQIDVSGLSLEKLLVEVDDSAFARAVNRILAADYDQVTGFQNSI